MTPTRIAYMPLASYPDAVPGESLRAAVAFAAALAGRLRITTFAVDVPQITSALGNLLVDVPGLVRAAEERNRRECARIEEAVQGVAPAGLAVELATRRVAPAAVLDAAAIEARYHDLAVLPWSGGTGATQEMAQAVIFGAGRPAVLVPPPARPDPAAHDPLPHDPLAHDPLTHIAIAWDGSRVAARALGDALPLLAPGGRVSVLTVRDEKPLAGTGIAAGLATALQRRGIEAAPVEVTMQKRAIGAALQEAALDSGAQLLAMGGFGHSRLRDFVLGGATRGIVTGLRLPALLSH